MSTEPGRRAGYPGGRRNVTHARADGYTGPHMHYHLAYGGVLALAGGAPQDYSPRVYVPAPGLAVPSDRARVLLALVEPVEPLADLDELAESVIATFLEAVDGRPLAEIAARICDAYARANDRLRLANRGRSTRRTLLGLTCVVSAGGDLLIAHVPPGQALVRQGQTLLAYPHVPEWRNETATPDAPLAKPLGLARETEPVLLSSAVANGDVVCLMSTSVAAVIGADRPALEDAADADALYSTIGACCDRSELSDGLLGVCALEARRHSARRARYRTDVADRPGRGRAPHQWCGYARAPLDPRCAAVQTEAAHDGNHASSRSAPIVDGPHTAGWEWSSYGVRSDPSNWAVRSNLEGPGRAGADGERIRADRGLRTLMPSAGSSTVFTLHAVHAAELAERREALAALLSPARLPMMTNILAGLVLSLVATVVGVWTVTRRDRPLHGPRDDGTLGMPRLQRWDASYRPPRTQRLRSALPHLESGRIILVGLACVVALAAGMYGVSRLRGSAVADAEAFEEQFQLVLDRHAAALSEGDQPTAYAILIEARTRLEELAASLPDGAVDSRIEQQRAAIQADIDRIANITRFQTVNIVGRVPTAPENVKPRLIAGGGRIFLLSDALYQLDPANATLVRLIASGDAIGDHTVGTIRGAVWRGDRPVVVDETSVWSLDPASGNWLREDLGTFDATGYVAVGAVEAYELNLYMLATDSGQILKFPAGAYASSPEDWADAVPGDVLARAVDMAVDGHIWVLMPNGRILNLFRSRIEAELQPTYIPPLDSAIAISAVPGSPYLYVLNASDGRVLRMTRDGRIIQQFTTPGSPTFHGAADFVIDEGTGVAYILAHDTLFSLRVPAAPR